MRDFDSTWQRIVNHQGETFHQKHGNPFTYAVSGDVVNPDRTTRNLPRSQFEKAWALSPLTGPGQIRQLQGPSYLYAILTDHRIVESS